MPLPPDLLLRVPGEAVRRIALSFLDEARAASARLDDAGDEEALHDFRVAVRRLRSLVRAWKKELRGSLRKRHRRALKKLQNATGGGRDAEVAVAWLREQRESLEPEHHTALDATIERLEKRHREAMAHVREDVRRAFGKVEEDLLSVLGTFRLEVDLSSPDGESAYATALAAQLRAHVGDLVGHLEEVESIEDREHCHQTRIRGKRLRYLVEPVRRDLPEAARVVKRLKRLQDVLGDLNDAHVLDAELTSRGDPELEAIVHRVRQRGRALFDRLEEDWLKDSAGELVESCDRLASQLEQSVRPPVEIERKFLLGGRPELPETAVASEIEQGWLPGDELQERLRCIRGADGARYRRTVKVGRGIQRIELEEETAEDLHATLWPFTSGCRVIKRRYTVADGDLEWEVDEFLDRDLWLAEVEFDDPAREVEPPAWLAPYVVSDVTGDASYVNRNLAK